MKSESASKRPRTDKIIQKDRYSVDDIMSQMFKLTHMVEDLKTR